MFPALTSQSNRGSLFFIFRFFSFSWLWSLRTVVLYFSAISMKLALSCAVCSKKNSLISPALRTCHLGTSLFNKANVFVVPSNPYADTCTKKKTGRESKTKEPPNHGRFRCLFLNKIEPIRIGIWYRLNECYWPPTVLFSFFCLE